MYQSLHYVTKLYQHTVDLNRPGSWTVDQYLKNDYDQFTPLIGKNERISLLADYVLVFIFN